MDYAHALRGGGVIAPAVLLIFGQAALPSLIPGAQAVAVPQRLDCSLTSYTAEFGGYKKGEQKSLSSESFIFPVKPEAARDSESGRLSIVRTLDDGRSWITDGEIWEVEWKPWPSFSGRIQSGGKIVSLSSDPQKPGRIKYQGSYITTGGGPAFDVVGECAFVPAAAALNRNSR